ncbi:MAG: caspase family protein [Bacteroidota bacterium]
MNERRIKSGKKPVGPGFPVSRKVNHLLAIGIDTYAAVNPLHNCVRDTQALVKLLQEEYQFDPARVYTLFNAEATRESILQTLEKLALELGPEDNLLIYFAGHGYYMKKLDKGFLVPVDGMEDKSSSMLDNYQIRGWLRSMGVHHLALIVDSCFSGALIRQGRSLGGEANDGSYERRVDAFPSRWGLAAGGIEVVSDGFYGRHSPFAQSLLTYFSQQTRPYFSFVDLVRHVKKAVASKAEQTPLAGPIQDVGHENGEFIFYRKKAGSPEEARPENPLPDHALEPAPEQRPSHPAQEPAREELAKATTWEQVQQLVVTGEYEKTFSALEAMAPGRYEMQLLALRGRYHGLVTQELEDVSSPESLTRQYNRLNRDLLKFVSLARR